MKRLRQIQNQSRIKPIAATLLICIAFGFGAIGFAEPAQTINLDRAIAIALENNPDLKQVSNQVELSRISLNQKKANFLPSLNISAQTSRQYSKSLDTETRLYISGTDQNLNASASLNLNLFNGGYDLFSVSQSKFELKSSEQSYSRYQQSVIFETIQQYIQVVLSGELIEVDEKNLEAQRAQLERIEAFFKSGRRPVADLYQQKAEISRYEYLLLSTERNFQVNKLLLSQILGWNPTTDFRVTNPGIEDLINRINGFNLETLLKEAIRKRVDILSQQNQIQAAKKEISAARSGYWPTLNLLAEVGTSYSSAIEGAGFSDQLFENHPGGSIGLSLAIPVFDKQVTRNNVARARINLNTRQLEMQKLLQQVSVEVQQALQDFSTAQKQVAVARSQEEYSKAALESVEERYHVNAATMAELIQARSLNYQSIYDLVEAKFNLLIRGIAVSYYQGDGNQMISWIKSDH